ncbi:MAG: hypothetical protein KY464_15750, partial [Gemmatimonadetes bacterium]|nr:hypothetical protein [Gemmatimonadota bacterium]
MSHQRISFGSYFNAFPASYWRRYTIVTDVTLTLTVEGPGATVVVYRSMANGRSQRVETVTTGEDSSSTFVFDLPLKPFVDGGWYWYDVVAGDSDVVVRSAQWTAQVPEDRAQHGTVDVCITTMNRPDFVAKLLGQLGEVGPELVGRPPTCAQRLRVAGAERVVEPAGQHGRPVREAHVVLGGHTQHLADHGDGERVGEVLDQLQPPARVRGVQQVTGQLLHHGPQPVDRPRRERLAHQPAQPGVVRRVHEQERPGAGEPRPVLLRQRRLDRLPARRAAPVAADRAGAQQRVAVRVRGQQGEGAVGGDQPHPAVVGLGLVAVEGVAAEREGGGRQRRLPGLRRVLEPVLAGGEFARQSAGERGVRPGPHPEQDRGKPAVRVVNRLGAARLALEIVQGGGALASRRRWRAFAHAEDRRGRLNGGDNGVVHGCLSLPPGMLNA